MMNNKDCRPYHDPAECTVKAFFIAAFIIGWGIYDYVERNFPNEKY